MPSSREFHDWRSSIAKTCNETLAVLRKVQNEELRKKVVKLMEKLTTEIHEAFSSGPPASGQLAFFEQIMKALEKVQDFAFTKQPTKEEEAALSVLINLVVTLQAAGTQALAFNLQNGHCSKTEEPQNTGKDRKAKSVASSVTGSTATTGNLTPSSPEKSVRAKFKEPWEKELRNPYYDDWRNPFSPLDFWRPGARPMMPWPEPLHMQTWQSPLGQFDCGQPRWGQGQSVPPLYSQPPYGPPPHDEPQYGQPAHFQSQYGQPAIFQPQYGQPQSWQSKSRETPIWRHPSVEDGDEE